MMMHYTIPRTVEEASADTGFSHHQIYYEASLYRLHICCVSPHVSYVARQPSRLLGLEGR